MQAGVDWMWEFTAVSALALTGAALSWARLGKYGRPQRLPLTTRLPAAVGCLLVCALMLPGLASNSAMRHLVELAGLGPSHRVLDVGCGIGRIAIPLTEYLSPQDGSYEGFDVVRTGVDWCRREITARHPHFRFQHVALHNGHYNRGGGEDPVTFRYPYPDAEFDVVFAISVFTHLLLAQAEANLAEIARVLAPGAAALLTFFLIDEASEPMLDGSLAALRLPHRAGTARLASRRLPELAVAHERAFVEDCLERHGLPSRGALPRDLVWPERQTQLPGHPRGAQAAGRQGLRTAVRRRGEARA